MPSAWQRHREPLLGLTYLVVLTALIAVSIAAFNKDLPWQDSAHVEVVTTHAGLELNTYADVKIQGRIVGEVRGVRTTDGRTVIELGIEPDELDLIPADVDAAIVPKTLFGEKYVDLLPPASATAARLADGDTIEQTATATEIGDIYDRLVPLLKAIDPAELSTVLTTVATTLEGRGTRVRTTLDRLGEFLGEIDPHLDTLDTDLRLLARTLDTYDAAAPDLLTNLANATALSTDLLVPAEQRLEKFLATLTDVSDTTREVLARNGDNLVRLVVRGEPLLALLEDYAPMIACSIEGLRLVDLHGNLTTGSRGPYVLLSIDMFIARQPYSFPADPPSNPTSEAALNTLPFPIRSWAPHCPQFGKQILEAVDAEPRSLPPMPHQVVTNERPAARSDDAARPSGRTTGSGAAPLDLEAQRLALATALARDLIAQYATDAGATTSSSSEGDADLGGLLVAPLLDDQPVEVP